jgi:hypothetical protein
MQKYVEFNCAFSLKRYAPDEVVDALLFMTGQDDDEPIEFPPHPYRTVTPQLPDEIWGEPV